MSSPVEQHEHSARLARALVALEKMQAKLEASEREKREPVAIVGMACRFPGGGNDPKAFWDLLREGRDTIVEVPPDRWDLEAYYDPDPDALGKMYTRWGGFLKDVRLDELDASFYGIAPREVASMDPQQRLMLEVTWEALANAGQVPERLANSLTGVFVGVMLNDYAQLQMKQADPALLDAYMALGNDSSFMAGRISYILGAQGPSMAVNTACSSSLVSVHLACQSLRSRECNMAIAGGVSVILAPDGHIVSSRLRSQSPHGRCKTFDASADGYVRGEGCGVVVLKRLSEAIADGDPVLAVIRGGAVNHDGPSGGLTVPSGPAQEAVIRRALASAGVEPSQVSYVEAHGTATPLGDPIEIRALQRVFEEGRPQAQPLSIGSVKTNVGHLEAAAGIAGLLKVVLMLQHREIPPHLHLTKPTPAVPWDQLPITIPTQLQPWAGGTGRRVAGISSFGLSGINAHLVVEEAPENALRRPAGPPTARPAYLLPLSARSAPALQALARAYQTFLGEGGAGASLQLDDICYTASARRSHYEHRLAVTGRTREALVEHLGAFLKGEPHPAFSYREAAVRRPKVVFVFSGQGSQWPGMGRELLRTSPVFRKAIEACEQAFRSHGDWSLLEQLGADESSSRMGDIGVLQPVLFAVAVALAAQWRSWGIEPDAVVGHSMGEVAAAYVSGILSLEDAAEVICLRSALLRRIRGQGAMALAELSLAQARTALAGYEDRLSIAASNSPTSTVLAGDPQALQEVMAHLQRQNIFCRNVKVDVASHSPQVEPLLAELKSVLQGLRPQAASVPVFSTVTGQATDGTDWDAAYWQRNLREPVLFSPVIEQLLSQQHQVFLELSPHPILLQSVERTMRAAQQPGIALPSLRREEAEGEVLLQALGALHTAGHPIDWQAQYPQARQSVSLPSYPWQRSRFWVDLKRAADLRSSGDRAHASNSTLALQRASQPEAAQSTHADGTASRFYDDSMERERVLKPDEVYLTFGVLRQKLPGFSWLMSVYGLSEREEHTEVLLNGQRGLRSVLFRGVDWSSVGKVLDFGCGYASDLISLGKKHPHLTLHGYTISAEQAAIDEERIRARGLQDRIRVFARDSAQDEFPDRYDLIFGFEVATHISDKGALFSNISRNLQNGGFLLLADFIANSVSAINVQETASYNVNAEEWADLLARHNLRVVESVDISQEAANFLEDPGFDGHLDTVAQRFKLTELVRRNFDAMRNFGKALERGLMSYALIVIQKDDFANRPYLQRANRAKLSALTPLTEFEDGGAWAAPSEGADLEHVAPQALREWVYEVAWPEKKHAPRPEAQPRGADAGRWLILADAHGLGDALAARLRAQGTPFTVLHAGAGLGDLEAEGPFRHVVHLWSLDNRDKAAPSVASLEETLRLGCGSLPLLVQRLGRGAEKAKLWLVTRGAQAVGKEAVSLAQAPLWGAGRVLALEHPELWGGLVDLSPEAPASELDALWHELTMPDGEDQIAFRGARRHVARLVRSDVSPESPATWREDGAYLITGGLGALGLQVSRWLVSKGVRHLVLASRSGLPEASQWSHLPGGSPLRSQAEAVQALQAMGASVQIVRCDVGEQAQVASLMEGIRKGPVPLVGIFHAAGVSTHRSWQEMAPELFSQVFRPKAAGAWLLHEYTRDMPLSCFVLFSSASAVWGAQGMAAYAAANHSLDALAHLRRSQGLAATSINWGRWTEGGMAGSEEAKRFFSQIGLEAIPTEAALALLGRIAGTKAAQRVVASVEWSRFKPLQEAKRQRPFLENIVTAQPVQKAQAGNARSELLLRLEEAPFNRRRALLMEHVRVEAARVLGAEPSRLEPQQGFFQMGMNSLMSIELKKHLETSLRHGLPSTIAFEYPTVDALTGFLAKEVPALAALLSAPPEAPREDAAAVDSDILDLLGEAARLSESELRELAHSFPGDGSHE
jgi:acyl transferase domain-containing protein